AARWHVQNDLPEEAVVYALDAGDFEYAAYLLTGPAISTTRRGETTTLVEWYRAFPPEFVQRQPRLCLLFGQAFALNGRWTEAETLLGYVEQTDQSHVPLSERLLLSYLIASYRQDVWGLRGIATEAAAQLAAQAHPDASMQVILGLILGLRGSLEHACR